MTQEERYKERKKWFVDRIGKTIYRNVNGCDCRTCKNVYDNGIIISDEQHALYIHAREVCSWEDRETGFRYFDTKEEVEQFEKSL